MIPEEPPTHAESPQGFRRVSSSQSLPPAGMTWPMVAYAFVREMPYTAMVVAGCVVACVFIFRASSSSLEPLAAVIVPAVISALGRSQPAETRFSGSGLAALLLLWKGGVS